MILFSDGCCIGGCENTKNTFILIQAPLILDVTSDSNISFSFKVIAAIGQTRNLRHRVSCGCAILVFRFICENMS